MNIILTGCKLLRTPYVYTAIGHLWQCKWQDVPGICDGSLCEKACGAVYRVTIRVMINFTTRY